MSWKRAWLQPHHQQMSMRGRERLPWGTPSPRPGSLPCMQWCQLYSTRSCTAAVQYFSWQYPIIKPFTSTSQTEATKSSCNFIYFYLSMPLYPLLFMEGLFFGYFNLSVHIALSLQNGAACYSSFAWCTCFLNVWNQNVSYTFSLHIVPWASVHMHGHFWHPAPTFQGIRSRMAHHGQ